MRWAREFFGYSTPALYGTPTLCSPHSRRRASGLDVGGVRREARGGEIGREEGRRTRRRTRGRGGAEREKKTLHRCYDGRLEAALKATAEAKGRSGNS